MIEVDQAPPIELLEPVNATPFDELLSRNEAATMLGVHPDTVWRWSKVGLLNPIKLPSGYFRYRKDEVAEVLAGNGKVVAQRASTGKLIYVKRELARPGGQAENN